MRERGGILNKRREKRRLGLIERGGGRGSLEKKEERKRK